MHRSHSIRSSCLAAMLALAAGACASDGAGAPGAAADFAGSSVTDPVDPDALPSPIVAEVRTVDGARLIFHDEAEPGGEPAIAVEILSDTVTPVTDAVLAAEPSALELFLATAKPGATAPAALLRDHELLAAVGEATAEPRALAIATAVGETYGPYPCHDSRAWVSDFQSWAPVLDGQYIDTSETGLTYGYVGYAPKFYFDVCRPYDVISGSSTYTTMVQRRPSASYAWQTINTATDALDVNAERRWRYYRTSWTCSSYQYRLRVSSTLNFNYRRAARWADEWSCQIGGISS